ncbi:MAG: hypothetical protein U0903_21470 [Planctomycetales bacterium]
MAMELSMGICTHKRAETSWFRDLAADCQYVSIHEQPIDLLRPRVEATETDLPGDCNLS